MKVRALLKAVEFYKTHGFPDIEDFDVYSEQAVLVCPEHGLTFEEYFDRIRNGQKVIRRMNDKSFQVTTQDGYKYYFKTLSEAQEFPPYNKELLIHMRQSYKYIQRLKKMNWKFVYGSDGDVYRECGANDEDFNCGVLPDDRAFLICNNY